MSKLTERQQQVLGLIQRAIAQSGAPPTRAEIATELGFRSANAAEEHLQALSRKGVIELVSGTSRGIRLRGEALRDLNDDPSRQLTLQWAASDGATPAFSATDASSTGATVASSAAT